MPLATNAAREFTTKVKNRANEYFNGKHVEITAHTPTSVEAAVEGTEDYYVKLDWSKHAKGELEVACTCPYYFDQGPCKHIWATILEVDRQKLAQNVDANRRLELILDALEDEDDDYVKGILPDEEDDEDDFERAQSAFRALLEKQLKQRDKKKPKPVDIRWQRQFKELNYSGQARPQQFNSAKEYKPREAWYVLAIDNCAKGFVIELRQREARLSGEWGVIKALHLSGNELQNWEHTPDFPLLKSLLLADESNLYQTPYNSGYGYYNSYSVRKPTITVDPLALDDLLPKLCATGRFVWMLSSRMDVATDGRQLAWDDGPPWQFQLTVEADDKAKHWRIRGQLVREGSEPVALSESPLLGSGGILLLNDRLAKHTAENYFSWVAILRRDGEVLVPYSQQKELVETLCRTGAVTLAALPSNLQFEIVHPAPVGLLKIKKPRLGAGNAPLEGTIAFAYEDTTIEAQDARPTFIAADGHKIIERDWDRERELVAQIQGANVKWNPPNHYSGQHDLTIVPKQLHVVVQRLINVGWKVEAEGGLFRQAGDFRLSVTSGLDWFQVDGEFEFGDEKVRLPELLAAIRRGDKYVKLGDGSQGMLPQAWLDKFGTIADMGQSQDGELRFRPSQALLLDALLASQPQVSFDEKFSATRAKLNSFRGIQPDEAPDGFTGQLRDYQKEGLGWFGFLREFNFGGCLADDMGLGKTIQVLALLQQRHSRALGKNEVRRPSLAVVPRSLVFNWMEEARKFTPELRVLDFAHKERGPLLEQLQHQDLILTTYGTLLRDITKLKDIPFDYAILDESQAIKNPQSQSAKACRLIQAEHRLALTGTPIENNLGELWSLFEFLNPGMLGHSAAFQRFSSLASYLPPPVTSGANGANGSQAEELERQAEAAEAKAALTSLGQAVAPFMLRRTKEQVLKELPDKTEQTIFCDLSKKERKHYDELREYFRASLSKRIADEGIEKSKIHVLEALLRLRQAACHIGLVDKTRTKESSAKLETLLEQLESITAEGHKALVFSQFTSLLAIVKDKLDAQKVVYEYLDGRTRNRQEKVDRFQDDPNCPLFLVSLKAGGRGLNLTAADYVFILDPWWNPAVEAQAVDRAHRYGQTKHVFAYRLIARDTVEEKILALQASKRDLADAIVSADQSVMKSLTADDLRMLLE
jgi:superfamily II DNA or RNA helicase